ncbi:glycerophosphodiester phosphodiesterase family protein [Herbaspirillum sp. RV1423]|uniref:glycerophosphodiester phosphodiesterase family protein n=1 Tax=Herbaspirillum sp. RV1423 TaxID=1443993 RepID=UPI0004BB2EE1|nr:glycerophosphodiester phosphodiesterase family protein [Herbaspirillum sp. RV1423]
MSKILKNAICAALLGMSLAAGADPLIAAHRGGTGDGPENTIPTLQNSLKHGADILWMTVQVSSDGVPVLYRPADVSALTDGKGLVNTLTAAQLMALNAGYMYGETDAAGNKSYPYRQQPVKVPTLRDALRAVPASTQILIDMKQLPAEALVSAVARVVEEENAWQRVRFYSTDADVIALMAKQPKARVFESRDATRDRLARIALNGGACEAPPAAGTWSGIELERKVRVVEKFTLGEGVSEVVAHWWTPAAMKCFKTNPDVKVVVFGVDSQAAYRTAQQLGVDVVMTDSPVKMKALREAAK